MDERTGAFVTCYDFAYDKWIDRWGDEHWPPHKEFEVSGTYDKEGTTYHICQQYAEIWEPTFRRSGKKGAIGIGRGDRLWDGLIIFDMTIVG